MRLDRMHWQRKIATLDPDSDYEEIYRIVAGHEFPWDMNQSLGLALYRTYAVPSIGGLLASTGEFTERTQKRYDDTGLILDAVGEHGLDSTVGRTAIALPRAQAGAAVPRPASAADLPRGYDVSELGTFPHRKTESA